MMSMLDNFLKILKADIHYYHRDYVITSITSNKDNATSIADGVYVLNIIAFKEGEEYAFSLQNLHISMKLLRESTMQTVTDLVYHMIVQAHDFLSSKTPELLARGHE